MKLDITLQSDIFNVFRNCIWNKFEIDCSKYSRVAYIYVRSRSKCLKFRTTTSKFNIFRKPLMQQKYYFIHEM